jgi:aryl-phospho-beta-D-glucosidase BglC (GH1 family)
MKTITGPSRRTLLWALALLAPAVAGAQSLPTAAEVANRIAVGWNIGNTLEVPLSSGGETGWGNPKVTQKLIDGVKAAGFNAVRIPCAWDSHADASTHQIDAAWLARVKEVVDYCVKDGLYVVLNIHWDGGWLENHPFAANQSAVVEKQKAYWTQIANQFKGYDEHLIFAGMNEINANWAAPSAENITAQQAYLQAFVDAVRATGGNNATRTLAVQTYSTNIQYGLDSFRLPTDSAANRLLVEVHFYDPYDYTGTGACSTWGASYPNQPSNCSWAQEAWMDDRFSKAKGRWVDQGVPVIVGEYGLPRRTAADQLASRRNYLKYLNASAKRNGLKTFYWDTGTTTGEASALVDRNTGAVVDQGGLDAIMQGAGVTPGGSSSGGSSSGSSSGGTTNYAVSVSRSGAGVGTVTSSPSGISCGATCQASFAAGTSVTLTAAPDGASTFSGWSGACNGTGTCTLSITKAETVTASFVPAQPSQWTLSVQKSGAGSGTVSAPSGIACGATCQFAYAAGTSVTLTAAPLGGSTFTGWSGDCSGTGTCTVSMTSARNVTATFTASAEGPATYALVTSHAGRGGGTIVASPLGAGCGTACGTYAAGTTVTLSATPDSLSSFAGWSGACSGSGTCTVSMTADRTVTGTFTPDTFHASCGTAGRGAGGVTLLLPVLVALLARRRRGPAGA